MSCCRPRGYEKVFGRAAARRELRRYRRRGLRRDARAAVAFLRGIGVEGATVLEAGGGIGVLQVELLEAGAARAVGVELSSGYDEAAAALLAERGLAGRVERLVGDFVEVAPASADAVVMSRVVCCYPDHERLVGAAASRARRALVFTHPPDGPLARAAAAAVNLALRLGRQEFRVYAHSVAAMLEVAEAHGLRRVETGGGPVWRTECCLRFPPGDGGNGVDMDETERIPDDAEPDERAEEATEESRRERGDMRIEEQEGLGAGREGDGKPRPF